jgi:hypothetical protein
VVSRSGRLRTRAVRVVGVAVPAALGVGLMMHASLASSVTATVGQTFVPDAADSCIPADFNNTSMELFQTAREDGTSYVVPGDGVITSWSFQGTFLQGSQVTLRVYRPQPPGPDRFAPVGEGGPVTNLAGDHLTVTLTRIPVRADDLIGLRSEVINGVAAGRCASVGSAADTYRVLAGTAPTGVGVAASYAETSGLKLDVAATVEPDVDHDGYGDQTQDACPRLAGTQQPCPIPNTTITHQPASPTRARTARFRFTSTVTGATYRCRLGSHPPFRCASPLVLKVKPGRHTLRVTAHANHASDPTPARARWRVRN